MTARHQHGFWPRPPEEEREGILLDLTPRAPRTFPWVTPLLVPLAIASVVMAIIASDPAWLLLGVIACVIAAAALWAPRIPLRARVLLCEDGLWLHGELVPWGEFEAYAWRRGGILELSRNGDSAIEIPVAYERRGEVEAALNPHVPRAAEAAGGVADSSRRP